MPQTQCKKHRFYAAPLVIARSHNRPCVSPILKIIFPAYILNKQQKTFLQLYAIIQQENFTVMYITISFANLDETEWQK